LSAKWFKRRNTSRLGLSCCRCGTTVITRLYFYRSERRRRRLDLLTTVYLAGIVRWALLTDTSGFGFDLCIRTFWYFGRRDKRQRLRQKSAACLAHVTSHTSNTQHLSCDHCTRGVYMMIVYGG